METRVYEYTTFPRRFVSYKWFKPLLVAALTAVFTFAFQFALAAIAGVWLQGDLKSLEQALDRNDPLFYQGPGALMGLGGVAVMLPALALAALIVRDRPFSSYSSSRGGFNWGAYFKYLAVSAAVIGALTAIELALLPDATADGANKLTAVGFVVFAVLVFFQGAAEEYVYRGLLMQAVGSWTKLPVVAILLSSLVFAASHSYDVLGIVAVFVDGLAFAFIAWYTKGLEATCAIHGAHNFLVIGVTGLGLASASTGGIESLVEVVVMNAVLVAVVLLIEGKLHWCKPKM